MIVVYKSANLHLKICTTMQFSEGKCLLVELSFQKINRKHVNLVRRQVHLWKGKMYIELKSNQQLIKVYMFNMRNWKIVHKRSQLFHYYSYTKGKTHFGKLISRGIWDRYRILKNPGFFCAFSGRNPKVAIFCDFSNFLRRRFYALVMDLEYFLLIIN